MKIKPIMIPNIGIQWGRQLTPAVHTKMINKKQALEILGVSPTNPIKNQIFDELPKYKNRFNTQAIFREEDVLMLLRNFEKENRDS